MSLNTEQFGMEYPYPRLRESYARNWATSYARLMTGEGTPTHPIEALESGRDQAIGMLEMSMADRNGVGKNILIQNGFRTRRDTQRDYASWYN